MDVDALLDALSDDEGAAGAAAEPRSAAGHDPPAAVSPPRAQQALPEAAAGANLARFAFPLTLSRAPVRRRVGAGLWRGVGGAFLQIWRYFVTQ